MNALLNIENISGIIEADISVLELLTERMESDLSHSGGTDHDSLMLRIEFSRMAQDTFLPILGGVIGRLRDCVEQISRSIADGYAEVRS